MNRLIKLITAAALVLTITACSNDKTDNSIKENNNSISDNQNTNDDTTDKDTVNSDDTKDENKDTVSGNADTDKKDEIVKKVSISKARISSIKNQTYTGKAIKPSVTVTYDSKTLKKDTDYTVSYSNNTKVGTAKITVTGKGNYEGNISAAFKIVEPVKNDTTSDKKEESVKKISIANASISDISNQKYTGSAIKPSITVTLNGKKLTKGTDYTVSYSNNTKAGTAKVTVKGMGSYEGTVSATFEIIKEKEDTSTNTKTITLHKATTYHGFKGCFALESTEWEVDLVSLGIADNNDNKSAFTTEYYDIDSGESIYFVHGEGILPDSDLADLYPIMVTVGVKVEK